MADRLSIGQDRSICRGQSLNLVEGIRFAEGEIYLIR